MEASSERTTNKYQWRDLILVFIENPSSERINFRRSVENRLENRCGFAFESNYLNYQLSYISKQLVLIINPLINDSPKSVNFSILKTTRSSYNFSRALHCMLNYNQLKIISRLKVFAIKLRFQRGIHVYLTRCVFSGTKNLQNIARQTHLKPIRTEPISNLICHVKNQS